MDMEILLSEEEREALRANVRRGIIREAFQRKLLTEEQCGRLLGRQRGRG